MDDQGVFPRLRHLQSFRGTHLTDLNIASQHSLITRYLECGQFTESHLDINNMDAPLSEG